MFKNRSKTLFISAILGTLYSIYIISYFAGNIMGARNAAEGIGASIATALVTPHMICVAVATIFNWLAFFMNLKWAAITSGILYTVGGIVFMAYILFVVPMIILSFVGVAKLNKISMNVG
jgi:hypothetical protein